MLHIINIEVEPLTWSGWHDHRLNNGTEYAVPCYVPHDKKTEATHFLIIRTFDKVQEDVKIPICNTCMHVPVTKLLEMLKIK